MANLATEAASCLICQEEIIENDDVCFPHPACAQFGHRMHPLCLRELEQHCRRRRNVQFRCPLCRRSREDAAMPPAGVPRAPRLEPALVPPVPPLPLNTSAPNNTPAPEVQQEPAGDNRDANARVVLGPGGPGKGRSSYSGKEAVVLPGARAGGGWVRVRVQPENLEVSWRSGHWSAAVA